MGTTVRTLLFLRRAIAEVIPDSWSFNITLLLAGVFGLSAGGSPNFVTLASLLAVMGVGVGGLCRHISRLSFTNNYCVLQEISLSIPLSFSVRIPCSFYERDV